MQTQGKRIRAARIECDLNQTQLAEKVGVSRAAVSQWEKDATIPTGPNLVSLARVLAKSEAWLTDGKMTATTITKKSNVVGYVGAGAEIFPFDDYAKGTGLERVETPMGLNGEMVAVQVRGDSMYPIEDGWLVFYSRDSEGVEDECVGKLCVVKVHEGPTLVKKLRKGSKKGLFTLESWNAAPRVDMRLDWAARVLDIRPK